MTGRRALLQSALSALALAATRAWGEGRPLRVGLPPYLPVQALVTRYRPLREHLERALERRVELYSAAGFRALAANARAGDYDIALLPPHLVPIAVDDWGHRLVARIAAEDETVLVATRPITPPEGLRGARIGAFDPLSITARMLLRWLASQGLGRGSVELRWTHSVPSGLAALDRGEVAAFVAARIQMEETGRKDLRVVAALGRFPLPAFVAHPTLPDADVQRIRDALIALPRQPAAGAILRYGFTASRIEDFAAMRQYADDTRRLLAAKGTDR